MIRNKHLLLATLLISVGIYSVCEMCEPLLSKLSEEKNQNDAIDKLWGLAWNVSDLVSCRERLMKLGVDTTEIKKGVKEGALVMTIKSHTHSVPTLFIEHT